MRTLLLKLEPLIWFMFGQGILIGTMLLTGWILVIGILMPLGIVDPANLDYTRAHALATSSLFGILPIGPLLLAALLVLPLWKGAHHVRSLLIDFGGSERDSFVATVLYLIAIVGSGMAIGAVVGL
jgi:fumarate reductase subunit D